MRAAPDHHVATEDGFTLVELLIYTMLLAIVLVIVGGFMFNSISSSNTIRTTSQASTEGQLIASSLQAGIENATAVTGTDYPDGSALVMARVATRGATLDWQCEAWYYSAADKAVYTTTTHPAVAITLPTGGPKGSWSLLGDGIVPVTDGTGPLALHGTSYSASLDIDLPVTKSQPVHIEMTAYMRTDPSELVSAPCF
ncbi:type II secretion system protein [Gryllotalpicola koreensis]|uniref:Prepilin-type N-terminal cleavage/methylation domain-containing protein n=1 Tax=Gryllotalpicola koreensis TaxID=993086 RepID=A0ABP8A4L6_9MICO